MPGTRTRESDIRHTRDDLDQLTRELQAQHQPESQRTRALRLEREKLLDTLAEIGGKLTAEEDVIFSGTKIQLPANMELGDAINFLREKQAEDEHPMAFHRVFNYRPWDGARATMMALKRAFGMLRQKSIPSFFGDILPELVTIPVSPTETEQVPWGAMAIPMLPGATFYLQEAHDAEMGQLFKLACEGPRKYRHHIEGIFRLVDEELKTNSLYRGKAFDGQTKPQFLDLSAVDPDKVIYSEEVMVQLEANVWSLMRYTDTMNDLGVPLKRAVLFEGPYGTGKTLGAYLTAKVAQEHGWTFVYCRPGRDNLGEVMSTARLYQPAVVFFEDLDNLADSTTSADIDHVSALLDIFDGIQAKGTRLIAVLTTNHADRIQKGMVRPGRLDAVIHIGELDAHGFHRMIEAMVPAALLEDDMGWDQIAEAMQGFLPAFAREAIDRAVRYNVARNQGTATRLGTDDFVRAAHGLRPQLELMEGAGEAQRAAGLHDALGSLVREQVDQAVNRARIVDPGDGRQVLRLDLVGANGSSLSH